MALASGKSGKFHLRYVNSAACVTRLIGKRRFTDFVLVLITRYVNVRWLLAKVSARNILDVRQKRFIKPLTINSRQFTIND